MGYEYVTQTFPLKLFPPPDQVKGNERPSDWKLGAYSTRFRNFKFMVRERRQL